MKRALFIGRWQPLHPGHKWLFNQKLEQEIPILIAVRDTPVNDSNPYTTEDVISNLEKEYSEKRNPIFANCRNNGVFGQKLGISKYNC